MSRLLIQSRNLLQTVLIFLQMSMFICASVADEPNLLSERIDQIVEAGYHGPEIPLADDYSFLRRVYLDLIGRGPMIEEIRAYAAEIEKRPAESQAIRRGVIDNLLERDEFSRQYARVFDVMFTERREKISTLEFREFLRQWLAERKPLNELCQEILAADGTGGKWRPAASFFINRDAEPNLMTRDVGRIFFGRDVQCAQCHDHPLVADYEQSEFYGILSFVNRTYLFLDEKQNNKPLLGEKAEGQLEFSSVFHPEQGKLPAEPVLPMVMAMDTEPAFFSDTDAYVVPPDKERRAIPRYSRRQQLAVLATHRENQSFNRNLANRIWASLMGTGIVHPVDMHHAGNPPVSASLLRLLADELVATRYDLREIVRHIVYSKAYQRSQVSPQLDSWGGPAQGISGLDTELRAIEQRLTELGPRNDSLKDELKEATGSLNRSQADVNRVQKQIDEAKAELTKCTADRDSAASKLTEIQGRLKKAQDLVASLTAALAESDKAVMLQPDDQELIAARDLLKTRTGTATESAAKVEEEQNEQQESVGDAESRIEDQKGRVLALSNRRLALGEFVVEARGVIRRIRHRQQALLDEQTDCEESRNRMTLLKNWLSLREQLRQTPAAGQNAQAAEQTKQLKLLQSDLLDLWRRGYAIRGIRGLSPEQFTGATYTALEMYRPVRVKALSEWEANHQTNPAERDDVAKREQFVSAALAANQWDTVEDLIVERFSLPAGAPQDGFFATIDQALTLQNDPAFQNWLKPASGNLTERLMTLEDSKQLADELYLSTLCRLPDDEERTMIRELLNHDPAQRATIVQELIWGVLASAEFRFFP